MRTYQMSIRTQSSKLISLRPLTCQRHVIPGRTLSLSRCQPSYFSTSHGSGGLGPTTDDLTAYHLSITAEDQETVARIETARFRPLSYPPSAFSTVAGELALPDDPGSQHHIFPRDSVEHVAVVVVLALDLGDPRLDPAQVVADVDRNRVVTAPRPQIPGVVENGLFIDICDTVVIGHGDGRLLVMAPATVQEAAEMVMQAFPLAEKYRNPVMILGDGLIGQMMEPVDFSAVPKPNPPAAGGLFAFSIAASNILFFRMLAHSLVTQAEAVVPSLPPPTGAKGSL